jgi:hypothetical protein
MFRALPNMVHDLTEYLVYPVSVVHSAITRDMAATAKAMENQPETIHTAAEKLSRFYALSNQSAYPGLPANTGANRAKLQDSAYEANVALREAQHCDPLLWDLYKTLEDPKGEFKWDKGTGKTASNKLRQYWEDGGLEMKTFVSVFGAEEE